jgi:hypothetical protein
MASRILVEARSFPSIANPPTFVLRSPGILATWAGPAPECGRSHTGAPRSRIQRSHQAARAARIQRRARHNGCSGVPGSRTSGVSFCRRHASNLAWTAPHTRQQRGRSGPRPPHPTRSTGHAVNSLTRDASAGTIRSSQPRRRTPERRSRRRSLARCKPPGATEDQGGCVRWPVGPSRTAGRTPQLPRIPGRSWCVLGRCRQGSAAVHGQNTDSRCPGGRLDAAHAPLSRRRRRD